MSESLGSQINSGDVSSFSYPEKRGGRKRRLDRDKYLNAVKRLRTLSDKAIGDYIGVNRSNVNRFKNSNSFWRNLVRLYRCG